MTGTLTPEASPREQRIAAFCNPAGPEVFHAIQHASSIARDDPTDVVSIHGEARQLFGKLVERATGPNPPESGRILLIHGRAGAGKTHLMRALRSWLHHQGLGYFTYMQVSTVTTNYSRYILGKVIESLDQPYLPGGVSGLQRLSNALVHHQAVREQYISNQGRRLGLATDLLRELEADGQSIQAHQLINRLAPHLKRHADFAKIDAALLAAMLYLQPDDAYLHNAVLKYLRGEDLSTRDREQLGGLVPRCREEDALSTINQLGLLMHATEQAALVVCLDQLEDLIQLGEQEARVRFNQTLTAVRELTDHVANSIVVISSQRDPYLELKQGILLASLVDRIEGDPEPIELKTERSVEEIRQIIARRLEQLFAALDVPFDPEHPTCPIPDWLIQVAQNFRTRDVLDFCRRFRDKAIELGRLPNETEFALAANPPPRPPKFDFAKRWEECLASAIIEVPEAATKLASVLADTIRAAGTELTPERALSVGLSGTRIRVDGPTPPLLVAVCNKSAQGGGLEREIREAAAAAGAARLVIVRSTAFPPSPTAKVNRCIEEFRGQGVHTRIIEHSDWRRMLAFAPFDQQYRDQPGYPEWRKTDRPMASLAALDGILGMETPAPRVRVDPDAAADTRPGQTEVNQPPARIVTPATPARLPEHTTIEAPSPVVVPDFPLALDTPIPVGSTAGRLAQPVTIDPRLFVRHAAFLGVSGSGKTTVAMALVEQLLLRGVPAILIDRKGDLCSYAADEVWTRAIPDALAPLRERLRQVVDVVIHTPGEPRGRPLSLGLVPDDLGAADEHDRADIAKTAASALATMLNLRTNQADLAKIAILEQAIHVLALGGIDVTMDALIALIAEQDASLMGRLGEIDARHLDKLAEALSTLRLLKGTLLQGAPHDRLNIEALLGTGRHALAGKVRLSIISTKFLVDENDQCFWLAQMLMALTRWLSKHPSDQLQAVLLMDEADSYLPAIRNPPTKGPLLNLLRRARSGGLGLFLATQSPGDLDYTGRNNIATWLIGKITQARAIDKVMPILAAATDNAKARLPGYGVGEFYLVRDERPEAVKATRSLVLTEQLSEERILQLARLAH